jgi:hypothetical protein
VNKLALRHGVFLALIILVVAALGYFCVDLNHEFYRRHGAFYDSLSYDQQLMRLMLAARASGPLSGLSGSMPSTVLLPWIQAVLLAPFIDPSRAVGIWIQLSWIMVTAPVGYWYFLRVAHYGRAAALGCALMFYFASCTFYWNGGLSDFRMDYLQYVLFGLGFYVYSLAREDGRILGWAAWGGAIALACLARSTTPVYVILVYVPFFLIDLWRQRAAMIGVAFRYAAAGLSCIALSGWFYWMNWQYLYSYYFIWNTDANAKLPLSQSWRHLANVGQHIGLGAATSCAAIFAFSIFVWATGGRRDRWNLRALWCGIAPVGYLILSGAGMNPFVSEVAVFGLMLFLLAPITAAEAAPLSRLRGGAIGTALLAVAAFGVDTGLESHTNDPDHVVSAWVPARASLDHVSRCIISDLRKRAPGERTFAALFTGSMSNDELTNTLVFDGSWPVELLPDGSLAVSVEGSTLSPSRFNVGDATIPAQWANLPGADDTAKIELAAREQAAKSDYFIVASAGSRLPEYVTVNRYTDRIAAKLADDVYLRPLCRHVSMSETEFVDIYGKDAAKPPLGAVVLNVPRKGGDPMPPASVDSFPEGLKAPGLFFAGVTPEGWLAEKARVRLARPEASDRLHIVGEVPAGSAAVSAGVMRILVDGTAILERPEIPGPFDLVLPIPKARGTRQIDLEMTGTDRLPIAGDRIASIQLGSIALEGEASDETDPSTAETPDAPE